MIAAVLLLAVCRPAPAQTTDYSKSVSQFPNVVGPYIPRRVPEPNLANSARIDQLRKNGTIYLSLDDAIALALENNLDLAIARYNLPIADTDILRAKSGANTRGGWYRERPAAAWVPLARAALEPLLQVREQAGHRRPRAAPVPAPPDW